MSFFFLDESLEPNNGGSVGFLPSIDGETKEYYGSRTGKGFYDSSNIIPSLQLYDGKLTDFISFPNTFWRKGFVLSKKVKSILVEFKLPPSKFFPVTILDKRNMFLSEEYFFFQILNIDFSWINFKKSIFIEKPAFTFLGDEMKIIQINDLSDFNKRLKDSKEKKVRITWEKMCFDKKLYEKEGFDIFYNKNFSIRAFISEKLKDELLNQNITGLEGFYQLEIYF